MVVSFSATTSRKISGQVYLEEGWVQGLDFVAVRRIERRVARSWRKRASRPGMVWGISLVHLCVCASFFFLFLLLLLLLLSLIG